MRSSYQEKDVIFLLKDITGLLEPQSTREREKAIQAGRHYCEMLPIEYVPTQKYMEVYREALAHYARPTARAVGALADQIMKEKGEHTVLVSLARAGTPIGILLKRYLEKKYGRNVPHYSISIIRGRGIDDNAMKFLLERYRPMDLLFVDGWIGKGAILGELKKAAAAYPGVSSDLAVLADPANVTELCGTHEDILIPSSCLNCTVSGLVSRTVLRPDIIGENDFHGAVYYGGLKEADLSYDFIHAIEAEFEFWTENGEAAAAEPGSGKKAGKTAVTEPDSGKKAGETAAVKPGSQAESGNPGLAEVKGIAGKFGISDINLIKPGIGETTRVLLRRVPWKVLLRQDCKEEKSLAHILRLAEEKSVPVEYYPLQNYKCCGIIKQLADA
ncbi:MAG: cysteine protease StiP family protein [Lachnospiraceae bacterium]|nr:cysteine protease StiP family protein [Lachnospiraceae bacterium]